MVSVSKHQRQSSIVVRSETAQFRALRVLFFIFLPALVTIPISALSLQGNITVTGTVTLPDGNPAVHVKVKISGQTGLNFDAMTDNSGHYQFQVPSGRYRL